jgi:hypothetical protein
MNTGINLDKLHEKEVVSLMLDPPRLASSLTDTLSSIGFRRMDDFCYLPRSDQRSVWQSETVITATFHAVGSELSQNVDEQPRAHSTDLQCKQIRFDYLLASLPQACIQTFLSHLRHLHELIGGMLVHRGKPISIANLEACFSSYVGDIQQELAEEPGSEILATFIEDSYPRHI